MTKSIDASTTGTQSILTELVGTFEQHLVIKAEQRDVMALWVLHTWVYTAFQHTPRLLALSPEKRCGKSTLLDLLRTFCCKPVKTDSASEAAIFRLVQEQDRITLLIDEADSFLPNHSGVRNVLNSGYEHSGTTLRAAKVNDDYQARPFKTFCPVAIAAIGELPDTIGDRAVIIRLRRKTEQEKVEKVRHKREALAKLAERVAQWAAQVDLSAHLNPEVPEDFGDRQADISVPLLALADHAGGVWPARARQALGILFVSSEEESEKVILLSDIRTIFREKDADKLASKEICMRLAESEDRPWSEINHGNPITPSQVGRLLKDFRISSGNIRFEQEVVKGYQRSDFEDAWKRYLPPEA